MASVVLKGIKKVFEGGVVAVHGMDLDVQDKEFIVLVGPSGCGKSTTLRMIAGLEEVTEGTISIDGRVVNDVAPKDRDIAMVFQNYALYPHMSVFDNMAFGLKLRKMPKREIEDRVHEAAQILGLEDYLKRKPKALSGGQRQRVAVGRAIVRKPKVFLFDEPLSNLDAKLRVQMRTEISRLHLRLGATMIYVTHDQTEAMTMADRIVLMKDGHVQQVGPPMAIYASPINMFVAGFIGSPAMNFVSGKLTRKRRGFFEDNSGLLSLPLPKKLKARLGEREGKRLVLGVRPEHLTTSKRKGSGSIKALVDVAEPLGNETLVYFSLLRGGDRYVARLQGSAAPRPGQWLNFDIDLSKVQFFEEDTGNVIS